jgi:hypothetical protein
MDRARAVARLTAVLFASLPAAVFADSEMNFVDVRLEEGIAATSGQGTAVTVMAGDIGDKEQTDDGGPSDLGIVIGLRASSRLVRAKVNGLPDNDIAILGGAAVGGFGLYLDSQDHMELTGGYELGVASDHGRTGLQGRDGTSRGYLFELAYFHTFRHLWNLQLGALGGYEHTKAAITMRSGSEVAPTAQGLDLAIEIGYRF